MVKTPQTSHQPAPMHDATQLTPSAFANAHPDRPWYVCLTKPRQEVYASQHLEEQGYAVFLPELHAWARHRGDWRRNSTVMFPRYVFVRPSHAGQAVGPIRSTPGVSTLVSFGYVLASLSPERLEALRTLVAARSAALPAQPFQQGAAVVFCTGPLKGASGIVSSVAAERVRVLMSLLGKDHTVLAPARDLVCA